MFFQVLHICNLIQQFFMRATAYFVSSLLYSIFTLIPIVSYYILNAMVSFRYKTAFFFFFWLYLDLCAFVNIFVVTSIRKILRIGNSEAFCLRIHIAKSLSRRTHPFTPPTTTYERVCLYTLNCGALDVALFLAGTHEKSGLFHFLLPVKED